MRQHVEKPDLLKIGYKRLKQRDPLRAAGERLWEQEKRLAPSAYGEKFWRGYPDLCN